MAKFMARDQLLTPRAAALYTGLSVRSIKYLSDRGRLQYELADSGAAKPMRRYRKSKLDEILRPGRTSALDFGGMTGKKLRRVIEVIQRENNSTEEEARQRLADVIRQQKSLNDSTASNEAR